MKRDSRIAFVYLAPALLVMLVCGIVPLVIVVNYSLQDSFAGDQFYWVGLHWFATILSSPAFGLSLGLSLLFSLLALAVEIPLGILIAIRMPRAGLAATLLIIVLAIPLLTPWLVVGYIFKIMVLPDAGLLGHVAGLLGGVWDMDRTEIAWATLILMDVWHWTSLVVLLCYAGLRAIPGAYYQAAAIDGASGWATFRHVQLPRLKHVLLIAVLLRFMDSFMIYAEPFVLTRGGPGVSTTFVSHELVQTALIQFDLGEGAAMSAVCFAIVLTVSWVFFNLIVPRTARS